MRNVGLIAEGCALIWDEKLTVCLGKYKTTSEMLSMTPSRNLGVVPL